MKKLLLYLNLNTDNFWITSIVKKIKSWPSGKMGVGEPTFHYQSNYGSRFGINSFFVTEDEATIKRVEEIDAQIEALKEEKQKVLNECPKRPLTEEEVA